MTALACWMAIGLTACGTRLSQQTIEADAGQGLGSSSQNSSGANSATSPSATSSGGTNEVGTPSASAAAGSGGSQSTGNGTASPKASGASSRPGGSAIGTNGSVGSSSGVGNATNSGGPPAGSVITLGNVGTYSGVIGAIFTGAQQSIEMWAEYTNAHGGLNGHPVKVVSADDGGDPSTSQSLVEQMVTQDHAIAFVGNLMPLTVQASLSYLQQNHIPVMGGDETTDTWFQSPVLFPEGTEIFHSADGDVKLAVAAGKTKMGFLYCVEDPVCGDSYNYFDQGGHARADGADPVYWSSFSLTQPTFTAQCIQAKRDGANFIFLAGDGNSLERVARDCSAQGYYPLYAAGSIAISASMQSDSQLDGMYGTQATFPWMDSATPAQAAYQQALQTYAPSLVSSGASSAEWTSGELVVAASKYLGANPSSSQFFEGLWTIKNNNLGGLAPPLTFNVNSHATVATCYFYIQLQGKQFVDPNHGKYLCPS